MPTISSSNVPPPKSWDEFEDITLSSAKLRWDSTKFFRHGRQGQKQDGVDIWGHDENCHIGIQCKNTIEGVTLDVVKTEIVNAESFEPALNHLYIATTAKRDAPLQKSVREISHERRSAGQFRVDVLFWDDVCGDLGKDDDVFFSHYPQFRQGADPAKDHDKALFNQLADLLRSDGVIGFLDLNNMAGFAFDRRKLDPLTEFYLRWNIPEHEFISPDLEVIRAALWEKVQKYLNIIAIETFPCPGDPGFSTVPSEWEDEQPERFSRVVDALHGLAGEIVALHRELIRTGRTILVGSAHREG